VNPIHSRDDKIIDFICAGPVTGLPQVARGIGAGVEEVAIGLVVAACGGGTGEGFFDVVGCASADSLDDAW